MDNEPTSATPHDTSHAHTVPDPDFEPGPSRTPSQPAPVTEPPVEPDADELPVPPVFPTA